VQSIGRATYPPSFPVRRVSRRARVASGRMPVHPAAHWSLQNHRHRTQGNLVAPRTVIVQRNRSTRWSIPLFAFGAEFEHAGDQGHANEIGEARCLHFGHEIGAIDFNRARADAEIEGNLLVGMAGNEPLEHVTLAAREAREPGIDLRPFSMALMIPLVPRQRESQGCKRTRIGSPLPVAGGPRFLGGVAD
jgi:hypothetical protein